MIQISKPDFPIGKLLATPVALEALQEANVDIIDLVERHISKDLGDLSDDDKRLNDEPVVKFQGLTAGGTGGDNP